MSATPAKNSPMEFYNLLQYIDPSIFLRYGIRSSTDFYDRFIGVEHGDFYNAKLEVQEYPQVKSFTNLDDFRGMLKRFCTFEVFETIIKRYPQIEKSIKVPAVNNNMVRMDVNTQQAIMIKDIQRKMGKIDIDEEGNIIQSDVPDDEKISALEGIVLMQAICIHPALAEDRFKVYDEEEEIPDDPEVKKAKKKRKGKRMSIPEIQKVLKKIDIHSPKLDAVVMNITKLRKDASKIMGDITCGNIVFIQNIVVQYMIRDLLIDMGIPKWSIGIMNATILKDPQSRQNLAEAFNFISEFYVIGDEAYSEAQYLMLRESKRKKAKKINGYRYDIIIANSIAYEGIDLQHRTCAIHHVDLAWESATITQRNGRGVRSGNEYEDVDIYYYIMKNTVDQYIYLTIQGKREWLVTAIESQDREINNLGASENSAEALLQLTATSQADYERRKAIAMKKAEQKRIEKSKQLIFAQIKKTGILFTQARTSDDPRIVESAENALSALKEKDAAVYPALHYVDALRLYRPTTFKSNMYDVVYIPGMMMIDDTNTVYVFLTSKSSGQELKFLKVTQNPIWAEKATIVTLKLNEVYSHFTIPEDVVIPFPIFREEWSIKLGMTGSIKKHYATEIEESQADEISLKLANVLFGKDAALKKISKRTGTAYVPEYPKKIDQKLLSERKGTFYRKLIEKGYISYINPYDDTGERTKNLIYSRVASSKVSSAVISTPFPRHMLIDMYAQGFLDVIFSNQEDARHYLLAHNTIDNSVWIMNGGKHNRNVDLFDMKIEKIEKDGYEFSVPKRLKPKKVTKITLQNVQDYITPELWDIYQAVIEQKEKYSKAGIQNSTFDGKSIVENMIKAHPEKYEGWGVALMKEYIPFSRYANDDESLQERIVKEVLRIGVSGDYITNLHSFSNEDYITIEGELTNLEFFEPSATGFRKMRDILDNTQKIPKIRYLSNWQIQTPNILEDLFDGKEYNSDRDKFKVEIDNILNQTTFRKEFNRANRRYFGNMKFDFAAYIRAIFMRGNKNEK